MEEKDLGLLADSWLKMSQERAQVAKKPKWPLLPGYSNRTRGHGLKFHRGRFRLDIRIHPYGDQGKDEIVGFLFYTPSSLPWKKSKLWEPAQGQSRQPDLKLTTQHGMEIQFSNPMLYLHGKDGG